MRIVALTAALCCLALSAVAGSIAPREGWAVHDTDYPYIELHKRLQVAVKENGMFLVTQAGPTEAAKNR